MGLHVKAADASLAFEQVGNRIRYGAAKSLKGLTLDMQARNVGVLDVPDACIIIMSGFDDSDGHFVNPFAGEGRYGTVKP